jgi:hypothetical protein
MFHGVFHEMDHLPLMARSKIAQVSKDLESGLTLELVVRKYISLSKF